MMIDSAKNERFRQFLSLTSSKGLKEEGLFLLSGRRLVMEFADSPNLEAVFELTAPGEKAVCDSVEQIKLSKILFDQVDVLGTHFNILVVKQPQIPNLTPDDLVTYAPKGIEVGLPLGDPGNLGAILRSCEAFGVTRAILSQEAAHPFLPKSIKASAGSVLRIPMSRGPALSLFPMTSIALERGGTSIDDFEWPRNALLLVGEEGKGFGSARFPIRVSIPTLTVESLNVVVAASIALSKIRHQINA